MDIRKSCASNRYGAICAAGRLPDTVSASTIGRPTSCTPPVPEQSPPCPRAGSWGHSAADRGQMRNEPAAHSAPIRPVMPNSTLLAPPTTPIGTVPAIAVPPVAMPVPAPLIALALPPRDHFPGGTHLPMHFALKAFAAGSQPQHVGHFAKVDSPMASSPSGRPGPAPGSPTARASESRHSGKCLVADVKQQVAPPVREPPSD